MEYTLERKRLEQRLQQIDRKAFEEMALAVFHFQTRYNDVYASYLSIIGRRVEEIDRLEDIPFLPIQLFKTHAIQTGHWQPETIFTSSGTTGQATSRHFVRNLEAYANNARRGFEHFYGSIANYCLLALLPSYLERRDSSLVYMAQRFIDWSTCDQSGFFLHDLTELNDALQTSRAAGKKVILLGVSFALWELAERFPQDLSGSIIMETGGMKGRRREITRADLHRILKSAFRVKEIHSEYGMTELLSQAYSRGNGIYHPSPTMRVQTREITDPFSNQSTGKTGVINIIDLANLDTISFIATEDLGKVYSDGSFEILGRLDASDLRGCNLMVADAG